MKNNVSLAMKEGLMFFLVIISVILLLSSLSAFYNPQSRESPVMLTKYILGAIAKVADASKNPPPSDANSLELRKWIVDNNLNLYLPNKKWCPATYYSKIPDNACDFFGNPVNIEYISNIPTTAPIRKFKTLKYNLIIWSSGANGINEWGQGDDIVFQ